jgi:hypothetical protein
VNSIIDVPAIALREHVKIFGSDLGQWAFDERTMGQGRQERTATTTVIFNLYRSVKRILDAHTAIVQYVYVNE